MHNDFYASGFIYHPHSQKILLQQNNSVSSNPSWSLFVTPYLEKEEPEAQFKDEIFRLLDLDIKNVYPVYSYVEESSSKGQYVVYSKLRKFQNFSPRNGIVFKWFSFKDILRLQTTEQTKHDLTVSQRVIDAADRKRRGEHTFQ